ncbi:MAG: CDP-alcohol phosphatidyltransferase family protein [Planctomycetes bacterium]|nr:CDP-alcohol phosphatidyltransferase family protein [Planctomycetota bacterium]
MTRLVAAAAFPALAVAWRLPVVVLAGFTDWLDGFIARRYSVGSTSGALLDAIADKVFALSVLLSLAVSGELRWWQVLLVVVRDVAVGITAAYAAVIRDWARFKQMRPRVSGKVTTMLVFVWFVTLTAPWSWAQAAAMPLFVLTAASSVVAAVDYLTRFTRALVEQRSARPENRG